jgi:GNAT superfamily N-acetyltransferase
MSVTITRANVTEQRAALEIVLRSVSDSDLEAAAQAEDLLESCAQNELSLDGLCIGKSGDGTIVVGLVILQADGTAHVWPPALSKPSSNGSIHAQHVLQQVAVYCLDWIKQSKAILAQCVTPIQRRDCHELLQSVGFEPLTELLCMEHTLQDIPHAPLPDDCEATSYTESDAPRFEAVMRAANAVSQDCKALQGRRTAAECLAAHRMASSFDCELWQLYHVSGEDMGIVLCANHGNQRMWELLYLGVVPKFRNQGFGIALVSDALSMAQVSGAEAVCVAVDASNFAAKSVYEMCGFQERFRKQIHIWTNAPVRDLDSTGCAHA